MKPPSNSNYRNRNTSLVVLGITITILGIILFPLKLWIMEIITASILVLKPNNFLYSLWQRAPDISTDLYFFDWSNSEDFHNYSIKPKFEDVGPYMFSQTIERMDVVWNSNNTVTFSQRRHLFYQDHINNGNLSKQISTINMLSLFISHYARNTNFLFKKLLSTYLATYAAEVNMTFTPQKYLFDGIDNFIVELGKYFPFISPELPRFDKLSLLSLIENYKELEGIINMGNGVNGIFDVHNFNFDNILPYFNGSCAKVRGTTGEISSNAWSKEYVVLFIPSLCRNARLDFEEEVMVHGIRGYKYSVATGALDNGTLIPGNECYCSGDCIPSGVLNISSSFYDFPFFASLPHFYGADPVYVDSVEGLQPRKDKHEAYIVVEPKTGVLLNASGRIQINVRISSIEDISMFENTREMIFPLMWVDQRSVLPEYLLILLKVYLIFPSLLTGIASFLIIMGLLLLCIGFKSTLVSWLNNLREKKQNTILMQEQIIPLRSGDTIVKKNSF